MPINFFTQAPEATTKNYTIPALIKQPDGSYVAGFKSDGKNEIRVSIKDAGNETLGYFVRAVLRADNYEIPLPKMRLKKPLWLLVEMNGVQTRLKL